MDGKRTKDKEELRAKRCRELSESAPGSSNVTAYKQCKLLAAVHVCLEQVTVGILVGFAGSSITGAPLVTDQYCPAFAGYSWS